MNNNEILAHSRLHLVTQVSDLEDVWTEGYEAANAKFDETKNPYLEDSTESEHWLEGWWAGFYGEETIYGAQGLGLEQEAANEGVWISVRAENWLGRVIKVAGTILAAVAILELVDLAA